MTFRPNRKILLLSAAAGVIALAAAAYFALTGNTEPPPANRDYSVTVAAAGGEPLRQYLTADGYYHAPLTLADTPAWLLLALLAAEDKRFYEHQGVDVKAVARALWQNTKAGKTVSGASTITQQLARAITPRERTFAGKLREMLRALTLEQQLSKQEILQRYLNTVSFSNHTRGAAAACEVFFNIQPRALTLSQAAFLAGIVQSPNRFDPVRRYSAALARRNTVLAKMFTAGYINETLYKDALAEQIVIRRRPAAFSAPQFCDFARGQYERQNPAAPRPPDGLIKTTIDRDLQLALERALKTHLASLRDKNVTNAALVALDNRTGAVLAWVGSADYFSKEHSGQIDGVTALRQPGSALKPFVYGLALERGWRASDLVDDSPTVFTHGFTPENYDKRFHGRVTLRQALACSYNIPAVYLAEQLGPPAVLDKLRAFGFASLTRDAGHYGAGLSLGNGEVTLLELANAYATLARGGKYLPWTIFSRPPPPALRVMDERAAFIITDILADNKARAAAFALNSPFSMPFPFAAKTGTSKDYKDNWAAGCTTRWTVAVWAGNFDATPMRKVSGITGAGPLLRLAAFLLEHRYPSAPFSPPPGLLTADVCPESGYAAGLFCPASATELFYAGNPPKTGCPLHKPEGAVKPERAFATGVTVSFPKNGDVFVLEPAYSKQSQEIKLEAASPCSEPVQWYADGAPLASDGAAAWWPLAAGPHRVWFTQNCGGKAVTAKAVKFRVIGYGEPVPNADPPEP